MSLTKEELKNALINNGVTPPPSSAKKEEFLALYEKHVSPVDMGEFSDDEISFSTKKKPSQSSVMSRGSSKSPKKKNKADTTEENSLVIGDLNLDEVDDDRLFELLQENGIAAGPIVDSTRPFYKKKLAIALRGEENGLNVSNGHSGEFSDTETEPEPEPEKKPEQEEEVQPSGVVSPQEKRTSGRNTRSPKTMSEIKSGLRKRMNLTTTDELDTSNSRSTPTPRRSIHSYKVSETVKHTVVLDKSGVETRDTIRTIERTESKGEPGKSSKSLCSPSKVLILLFLLLVLGAAAFYWYHQETGMSVEQIVKSMEESIKKNPETVSPPPRDIPDQDSISNL